MSGHVRQAIADAEALIRDLQAGLTPDGAPTDHGGLWFMSRDDGSLMLTPEETASYYRVANALHNEIGNPEQVSPRTVEGWLQTAILASLDMHERRRVHPDNGAAIDFDERVRDAVGVLRAKLTSAPQLWTVWHPVCGFTVSDLPLNFGPIQVAVLEGDIWQTLLELVYSHIDANSVHTEAEKKAIKQRYSDQWLLDLKDETVMLATVYAYDSDSAIAELRRIARVVLDTINFLAGEDRFNKNLRARVSLPEDAIRHVTPAVAYAEGVMLAVPRSVRGPMRSVELASLPIDLWDTASDIVGAVLLSQAFRPGKSEHSRIMNSIEWLLTTAMSWAGRGEVSSRPEEALLFYMVALESLVLHPGEKTEASFKLGIRVAYLVEPDASLRRHVTKRVSALYDLRSQVVHNGYYRVLPSEVGEARHYARMCILKLLRPEVISKIGSASDLREHMTQLVLGAR